ncbi:MAG: hypothetical protein KC547_12115 [Anaerolineae bacterium]|nr:hypothetical protein [Anaerolineae bacterium]
MTRPLPLLRAMALLAGLLAWTAAALAQDGPKAGAEALRALVNALGTGGYSQTSDQISALAATGDPTVAPVLQALADGDLYVREADGAVFIAARAGKIYRLRDPLSGQDAGEAGRKDIDKIKVNNSLRRAIRAALGALTLQAGDLGQRLAAAQNLFKTRDPEALESLDAALAKESDPGVRAAMAEAISPSWWPPIPSATTKMPKSGRLSTLSLAAKNESTASWLFLRTMPMSLPWPKVR